MKLWDKEIEDESLVHWVVNKDNMDFYYDFGNDAIFLGSKNLNMIIDDWLEHEKEV